MLMSFLFLFAAHCIADFGIQSDFVVKNKSKDYYMLLVHCAIYTVVVAIGFLVIQFKDGVNIDWDWVISIILYSHFIIDFIKCRFRRKLYSNKEIEVDVYYDCEDQELRKRDVGLLWVDQLLHVAIIFAIYTSIIY
jgi:hypothetical protein